MRSAAGCAVIWSLRAIWLYAEKSLGVGADKEENPVPNANTVSNSTDLFPDDFP